MLSPEFLEILRCPDDHSRLTAADGGLLSRLNESVATGQLKNRGGRTVEKRLDGALLRRRQSGLSDYRSDPDPVGGRRNSGRQMKPRPCVMRYARETPLGKL